MANPVAPGKEGYNLLSAKGLYRVVILYGEAEGEFVTIEGPLVLESADGAYKCEIPLEEAHRDGPHLVFDFFVPDRRKKYKCYLKDDPLHLDINVMPAEMGTLNNGER